MDLISKLNKVTNDLAGQLEIIRKAMPGKGITPDKSPMVEMKLLEIENKLRMIASNPDDIIPFN